MTVNCSEWRDKKQWRHVDWQTRAPAREPAATAATTPHSRRNRIRSRGGQLRSTQHLGQWSYTILFWYIVATSAHKPHRQHAGCGPFIHMSHVAWSMCLCSVQGWDVQKGWTDRDAVWGGRLVWAQETLITRGLDPTERISVMGVSHGIKSRRVQRWMQLQRWVCMRPLSIYFVHLFLIVVLFNWYAKNRLLVCPCCLKCVTVKDLYCQTYRVNGACRYFCFYNLR